MKSLQEIVEKAWPFTQENYPGMPVHSDDAKKLFALRHIQTHLADAAHSLGRLLDDAERGRPLNNRRVQNLTRNAVIGILRLQAELGLSEEQTRVLVRRKFNKERSFLT